MVRFSLVPGEPSRYATQVMPILDVNPYDSGKSVAVPPAATRRWPAILTAIACVHYGISAITLPFANAVWIAEIPLLAVFQIPKSFIKSVSQDCLLSLIHGHDLSRGSASPDYIATHGLAMFIMVATPALLLASVLALDIRGRKRIRLITAVLLFATVDALVTIWFDSSFSLKLYNASYF